MSKSGPIVLVEDDPDDKELFEGIVKELNIQNKIEWFVDAERAYNYLDNTLEPIFLIFCDINMPGKNGLEFKREIDLNPTLRRKSIPFIYLSTAATQKDIDTAYIELTIQGFFKKGNSYEEMKSLLKSIFDYWTCCKHPNSQNS